MTFEQSLDFARSWVEAVRENPHHVGVIYPNHPPISYEMLNEMVAAIDGKHVVPLNTQARVASESDNA